MTDGTTAPADLRPKRLGRVRLAWAAGATAFALSSALALAQDAERRSYTLSPQLRGDLDAHLFDAGQYEGAVAGIAEGLADGNLARVLNTAEPTIRVTEGTRNLVLDKDGLGTLGDRLLKVKGLREAVLDDGQTIVRGDEVGLARGAFWIRQACLDEACTKKKISLVTINLP